MMGRGLMRDIVEAGATSQPTLQPHYRRTDMTFRCDQCSRPLPSGESHVSLDYMVERMEGDRTLTV